MYLNAASILFIFVPNYRTAILASWESLIDRWTVEDLSASRGSLENVTPIWEYTQCKYVIGLESDKMLAILKVLWLKGLRYIHTFSTALPSILQENRISTVAFLFIYLDAALLEKRRQHLRYFDFTPFNPDESDNRKCWKAAPENLPLKVFSKFAPADNSLSSCSPCYSRNNIYAFPGNGTIFCSFMYNIFECV